MSGDIFIPSIRGVHRDNVAYSYHDSNQITLIFSIFFHWFVERHSLYVVWKEICLWDIGGLTTDSAKPDCL